MSLIQIKVVGLDTVVQLDAEDDRTYRLTGADETFTVDMARVGDRLQITLLRPADAGLPSIHDRPAESLDDFDRRTAKRRVR